MIPRNPIRTDRLLLEPVELRHAEAIWEAVLPSLPELRPWLPWAPEASLESTLEFARDAQGGWAEGTEHAFTMLEEGTVVGGIGLHTPRTIQRLGELGYWVRTDRAGRGYATEAGRAFLDLGFGPLDLYRIEVRAGLENRASRRVAEKLAFTLEGTLRRGCPHGDSGYDCCLYGLLREDHRE